MVLVLFISTEWSSIITSEQSGERKSSYTRPQRHRNTGERRTDGECDGEMDGQEDFSEDHKLYLQPLQPMKVGPDNRQA